LALAVGLALPAQAQSGTGSITGRVLNLGNSKYVGNAVVTVEGTNIETLTNDYGEFRLNGVPAGEAKVKVVSGGLDTEVATVTVTAGASVNQDFNLTSAERYGDKTLQLDTFVVAANREFEGNAIATAEQRFAKGLKVVVAADAFGDVTEGNAGEFLKFLPGVTVDYVAADVRTVSVRGFAANFTNVFLDGMPITSSNSGAAGRQIEFEQLSINNASRVEVLKVPTPDTPANGIGGNVNMVSKSSLERKGSQFNYRVYLSMNNEEMSLKKTRGPRNESSYKVLPGFDFDYTLPINKNLGIVITGLSSSQFNEQHRWQTTWNFQQGGGTVAAPFLQSAQLQDGPKFTDRQSTSIKADWRISDNQRLSVMVQDSYYHSFFGNRNLNFDVGTTTTTAAVGGTTLTFGPTFSQSSTGTFSATDPYGNRGRVTQGSSFRDKYGNTTAGNFRYSLTTAKWDVEAGGHAAQSRTWYRVLGRGHFANIGTRMVGVSNLRVDNIDFPYHTFVARDAAGIPINPYSLNNFRLTTATDDPIDGKAQMMGGYVDAKRDFDIGKFPLGVKVGARMYEESKDNRRATRNWTFVGPDGIANTADDSAANYIDANYSKADPYWGSPAIEWVDAYKLAQELQARPNYFSENLATSEAFRINNSEKVKETITAYYLQLEGKFLNNRLEVITGARYENTHDQGQTVLFLPDNVFQRNADGSYVLVNGARVRKPEAGLAGSLEEVRLTRIERGNRPDRSYSGTYPSLNFKYDATQNLVIRLGYAKTFGRPDYTNILSNANATSFDENDLDPTQPGVINLRNAGLKPWTADNYDLSLEYYFSKSGFATAGVFQKDIADFFSTFSGALTAPLATELDIDPRYVGWTINTTVNGTGTARIIGYEASVKKQLDFLPGVFRNLSIDANYTKLELSGPSETAFVNFIPVTGNFAVSWNKKPVSAQVKFNYRGRQLRSAQTGAQYGTTTGFNEYYKERWNMDVNVEYTFSKRFKLFANARNVLNEPQILQRYSEAQNSAIYAQNFQQEEFGIQLAVGVKGTF
jgi:TonB-dependent receptor